MPTDDAVDLFFADLEKLGPGSDAVSLRVLRSLPAGRVRRIVDAGCGTGRTTLLLASELRVTIDAVDLDPAFLATLARRADARGLADLVRTHRLDMRDLASRFRDVDLLWCEGAAYVLGFAEALASWRPALSREGIVVVSDCCWLGDDRPQPAKAFWSAAYPHMATIEERLRTVERSAFRALSTHALPREAWEQGYYEELERRARGIGADAAPAVRELAASLLDEIELFRSAAGASYGYVVFVLDPAWSR